jgi:hypothetical protein
MKSWRFSILGLIALLLLGNWISRRIETHAPIPSRRTQIDAPKPTGSPTVADQNPPPPSTARSEPIPPSPRPEASRASSRRDFENPLVSSYEPSSPAPRHAENAEPEVAADFDKVALMLRAYRTIAGENPVGTNAEIMKAIMGGNPKSAQLGPPDGQTLNGSGELVDRWGTPYFFHQLSKDLTEIHSAGPDRRMGTQDDLVSH